MSVTPGRPFGPSRRATVITVALIVALLYGLVFVCTLPLSGGVLPAMGWSLLTFVTPLFNKKLRTLAFDWIADLASGGRRRRARKARQAAEFSQFVLGGVRPQAGDAAGTGGVLAGSAGTGGALAGGLLAGGSVADARNPEALPLPSPPTEPGDPPPGVAPDVVPHSWPGVVHQGNGAPPQLPPEVPNGAPAVVVPRAVPHWAVPPPGGPRPASPDAVSAVAPAWPPRRVAPPVGRQVAPAEPAGGTGPVPPAAAVAGLAAGRAAVAMPAFDRAATIDALARVLARQLPAGCALRVDAVEAVVWNSVATQRSPLGPLVPPPGEPDSGERLVQVASGVLSLACDFVRRHGMTSWAPADLGALPVVRVTDRALCASYEAAGRPVLVLEEVPFAPFGRLQGEAGR